MKTTCLESGQVDITATGQTFQAKCHGCQIAAVQVTTTDPTGATAVTINIEVSIDEKTWVEPRRSSDGGTGYFSSTIYGSNVSAILYSIDVTGYNYIRVRNTGSASTTGQLQVTIIAETYSKTNAVAKVKAEQPYKIKGTPGGATVTDGLKWFSGGWDRCLLQVTPSNYSSGTLAIEVQQSLDGISFVDALSVFDVYPSPSTIGTISVTTDGVIYPLISCVCTQYLRARVYTSAVVDAELLPILTTKEP